MANDTTQPESTLNDSLEEKHDQMKITNIISNENTIQDSYEKEFERIMQEHENRHISQTSMKTDKPNIKISRDKPSFMATNEMKFREIHNAWPRNIVKHEKHTCVQTIRNTHQVEDYPSELNPFADDERKEGPSTNPFGDSDEEPSSPVTVAVVPPQPKPRRSVSTTRSNDIKSLKEDQDNKDKMPIPLPRTISKSVPVTPDQSPLLRMNRSFRLPGSGPSLPGSNASAYNSIRRKKKPAPPPPNNSLPILSVLDKSPTASPTPSRLRKARPAPPPPPPKQESNKVHRDISPSQPKESG